MTVGIEEETVVAEFSFGQKRVLGRGTGRIEISGAI